MPAGRAPQPPTHSATIPKDSTSTPGTMATATTNITRSAEKTQPLGTVRYARQRGRMVSGSVCGRGLQAGPRQAVAVSPGALDQAVSARGPRRIMARRAPKPFAAPPAADRTKIGKARIPRCRKASGISPTRNSWASACVRPWRIPTAEEAARYEITPLEKQELIDYPESQAGKQ